LILKHRVKQLRTGSTASLVDQGCLLLLHDVKLLPLHSEFASPKEAVIFCSTPAADGTS